MVGDALFLRIARPATYDGLSNNLDYDVL